MKFLLAAAASAVMALGAAPLAAQDNETRADRDARLLAKDMAEMDQEAFAKLTEGRVAGEPTSCVNTFRSNGIRIVEEVGLVYESGDTIWIAIARNPKRLDDFDVPVIERHGSHLCKFDQITMVDRTSQTFSGVLFLHDFVPYTKVKDETSEG